MKMFSVLVSLVLVGCSGLQKPDPIDLSKFSDGIHHWELFHEVDYERYDDTEVLAIANNILAYQNEDGGWPKNIDILAKADMNDLLNQLDQKQKRSTLDNRNTFPQIEYLAKAYEQTGKEKYRIGAVKGIDYILISQLANGSWRGWDVDAITYNDEVMTGALDLLLDIRQEKAWYNWLDPAKRLEVENALAKGLDLTLKCQVIRNGRKTAWAQQHDHETYEPVQGRSYELPAITAFESVPLVRLLMRIEEPKPEVVNAIESAILWFEISKLYAVRIDTIGLQKTYDDYDKSYELITVVDSTAGPIWARYYDVETNEPIFCRRDGVQVESFNEIDVERRWGYEWYGTWPKELLEKDYPEWKSRIAAD